jgi:hypothetical protein
MELEHGCRSEYGPLELRIETTASSNNFIVYVEDLRLPKATVFEHTLQNELDFAKAYAILRAGEYLTSHGEAPEREAEWRCS